jgi:hypothetical protein
MLSSSMPAEPRLALTCWYASPIPCVSQCLRVLPVTCRSFPQVDGTHRQDNVAPSLHPHYKGFRATTGDSAPCPSIGILPRGVGQLSFPFTSGIRFSRSIPKPVLRSCRLYTGCHRARKQVTSRFVLKPMVYLSFATALLSETDVIAGYGTHIRYA